jgi:dTDP-L-rhamnose 4-epimerase
MSRLVLVTGGAGFIGSHVVDRLLARGDRVRIFDSLAAPVHDGTIPPYVPADAEFIRGDVRDAHALRRALDGVTAVVHLAAYQDYLTDFSTFCAVNGVGTSLLYELIVRDRLPVAKVVVASSQAVMGEGAYACPEHGAVAPDMRTESQLAAGQWDLRCSRCGAALSSLPTDETFANPQNIYAISKHLQERLAVQLGRRYGIPSVALRYSIVQGPRQSFRNTYSGACRIFALAYHFDRQPTIYEDGLQTRDFVNVHDAVRATLLALDDPRLDAAVLNVGGGRAYTIREFAEIVAREFGVPCRPVLNGDFRYGDTRHILSDISRLGALGWAPERHAAESVREYVQWLRQEPGVVDHAPAAVAVMRAAGVVRGGR